MTTPSVRNWLTALLAPPEGASPRKRLGYSDVFLAFGAIYFQFGYKPLRDELAEARGNSQQMASRKAQMQKDEDDFRELQTKMVALKKIIDGKGHTLMPGLIDAHVHFGFGSLLLTQLYDPDTTPEKLGSAMAKSASQMLLRGFTAARDMGGPIFPLKRAIDAGKTSGPRIWPSGAVISRSRPSKIRARSASSKAPTSRSSSPTPTAAPTASRCTRPSRVTKRAKRRRKLR